MPNAARKIAAADAEADDHLTALDYQRLSGLISTEVGIKLPPAKRLMVEGRLRRRLRALGHASFSNYCDFLFRQGGLESELRHVINAVTTNKTDFFREPEHFTLLEQRLVPDLLRERSSERTPLLKIWSAAASTGAEAFTIAMVLADLETRQASFRFAVLGTDVSTTVLAQGRRGVYAAELVAPVPADKQARYLMHARRQGVRAEVRVVPELRRRVQFAHLNLMDDRYPFDRDVDIVFLRNVLIYFEKADQEKVIARLVSHLRPKGYLVLGHSESMVGTSITMQQVAPAVFQKG